jgi:rRNA-processing protein FCF1
MSQSIIIDACGWVAIIDSEINLDIELEKVFGTFKLLLLDSVLNELKELEKLRPKRKSLLLSLLEHKSSIIDGESNKSHTDDQIYSIAKSKGYAVLTVDKELKKRLYQSSITVIEVIKKKHINLIEGL